MQEAVQQATLAVRGDPLHVRYRVALALSLSAVGRRDEAEELLHQTRDLDPNFVFSDLFLAMHHAARLKFAEGLPFAEKAYSISPWYSPCVGIHAGLLVRTGEPQRGVEIVRALGGGEAYGASKGLAFFHTLCGDFDEAANRWERAIAERDPEVTYHLQGEFGEPVRASPHWPRLAALMNLPGAATQSP